MKSVIVESLSKRFGKGKKATRALDHVSFSVNKGEIFGLLGPNGAGKTTLISIMTGLLEKDSGRVSILNYDLDADLIKIQKRINLMLGFTGIGMSLTVKEFLKYYCLMYGLDNIEARIARVIKAVEIEDKMEKQTMHLSSGYKQRLMLAKALLNEPQILFLDEPTVGLDVEIAIKIRALIKELKAKGTTIFLTTHNMYEVEELCDRIALINYGKILAMGTVEEIKKLIKVDKVIEVEVDNLEAFAKEMKKCDFVIKSQIHEDTVHIKVESYKYVRKVLALLSKSKYRIYSVRLVEPTLEEAFLKIVYKKEKPLQVNSKIKGGKNA